MLDYLSSLFKRFLLPAACAALLRFRFFRPYFPSPGCSRVFSCQLVSLSLVAGDGRRQAIVSLGRRPVDLDF